MARDSQRNLRRRQALGDHGHPDNARDDARRQVAYIAARLIAEDGITDYAAAKHKAARQAGLSDAKALPDNDEIDAALRSYLALYQADEYAAYVRELRELALEVMQILVEFEPRLTGAVVSGTATQFSPIEIDLRAESAKAVELFLINRRINYKAGSTAKSNARRDATTVLTCEYKDIPVVLRVVDLPRSRGNDDHLDIEALQSLLAESDPQDPE